MVELETKKRILEAALPLFSDRGVDGVSIRALAKAADVNIAAINYHFQNKENLYFSVVHHSYLEMRDAITSLEDERDWTVEDFVLALFDRFMSQGTMLVNTFKIFISGGPVCEKICESEEFNGPPGAEVLAKILLKEAPDMSDERVRSLIHLIFSQVTHTAVLLSSNHFRDDPEAVERDFTLNPSEIKKTLRLLVRMGMSYPQ